MSWPAAAGERRGPLAGVRVLDLSRILAGPFSTQIMADLGADVIKVERPGAGDETRRWGPPFAASGAAAYFYACNRGRRSIALDLRTPEDRAIVLDLAAAADVLLENFLPGTMERLGLGDEVLSARNERLVHGVISGYGHDSSRAAWPLLDFVAQAHAGILSVTGPDPQTNTKAGVPIADLSAGLFCAMGILVALLERETSGRGQHIETSLLQAQIFMLDFQAARWLMRGEVPPQAGNNHPTSIPTGVFRTRDGHINIAAAGHHIWERLARELGAEEWLADPRFATGAARSENRNILQIEIDARTEQDDSATWIERLNAAGVPCGPINSIDQTFAEPQVQHLGIAQELDGIRYVGQPVVLARTPGTIVSHPPERGQHTAEILHGLGLSTEEIDQLRERKII